MRVECTLLATGAIDKSVCVSMLARKRHADAGMRIADAGMRARKCSERMKRGAMASTSTVRVDSMHGGEASVGGGDGEAVCYVQCSVAFNAQWTGRGSRELNSMRDAIEARRDEATERA